MRRVPFRGWLPRQRSRWFLVLAGLLIAGRLWTRIQTSSREFDFTSSGPYHVARVQQDGRLILQGNIALRLIGVDTPAGKPFFASRAADFLQRIVEGRDVTVELDRERKDRDGNILAYVSIDGLLLNEELIRTGLSRADPHANVDRSMITRLRRAEEEARQAGRGIWDSPELSAR